MLMYWEASPVFSRTSSSHHVISSCNLLVNIKGLESSFFSLSASDEAAAPSHDISMYQPGVGSWVLAFEMS